LQIIFYGNCANMEIEAQTLIETSIYKPNWTNILWIFTIIGKTKLHKSCLVMDLFLRIQRCRGRWSLELTFLQSLLLTLSFLCNINLCPVMFINHKLGSYLHMLQNQIIIMK
jgi:hypothetical protein